LSDAAWDWPGVLETMMGGVVGVLV